MTWTKDTDAVLDRMQAAYKIKGDAALSRALHHKRTVVNNWRNRHRVPLHAVVQCCLDCNLDVREILLGADVKSAIAGLSSTASQAGRTFGYIKGMVDGWDMANAQHGEVFLGDQLAEPEMITAFRVTAVKVNTEGPVLK